MTMLIAFMIASTVAAGPVQGSVVQGPVVQGEASQRDASTAVTAGADGGTIHELSRPTAPMDPGESYDPLLSTLDVRSDVAPREAQLGVEMVWSTGVTHPVAGSVGFAAPYTGGTLTVKDATITKLRDGQTLVKVVVTGLDLGEFTLPPLPLRFTDSGGGDHPFNVLGGKVRIVGGTGQEPAADLIAPVPIYGWNPYFFAALAALAAGALGLVLWRRRRRAAPPPAPAAPVDPRTPAQRALDAIFKLQTSGMLERREVKAFTFALDDIVRAFLIESYGAGELSQTTDEFLHALRERLHPAVLADVAAFFNQGDRVRFAGAEHESAEAKALCDAAITLVERLGKARPAKPEAP